MNIPPAPEFLLTTAETWQEAIPMMAKACIRPSDNNMGRSIKLTHWMELSLKYLGVEPEDWWKFVRNEADLPLAKRADTPQEARDRARLGNRLEEEEDNFRSED